MSLKNPVGFSIAAVCLASGLAWSLPAGAIEWPQEITSDEGTIVIYQPQPEKLEGDRLTGRAAMSLELKDRKAPVFGAFWFDARIDTDSDSGIALIRDIRVTNVRWPESKDAGEQRFTTIVEGAVPANGFEISMEDLSASLETAQVERESLENLNNDPPQILFREELSVLLLYDGEPRFSPVQKSDYERVLNTPFLVVRHKEGDHLFLSDGTFWYTAPDPMGPWTPTDSPPQDLLGMLPEPESDGTAPAAPPAIVTAQEPTELIVTQGAPEWQSLPGGELLYVQNTETPWLRELSTDNMYVLLSGRWYRAKSQAGPWTFVRPDELPASFAQIPPDSDIGGVRTSVAGTPEAEDAMLDAEIPQTAAIERDKATLEIEYDGEPKFERISGTSVAYAVNTGAQVLRIDERYYAVDNGVWFTSSSPTGPWAVADSIPSEEIDKIPPDSPVYNTTYVHIYDSTPEVVYVGYTPGYLWSFPYYGVPVYGTGWHYPPYYGAAYYPRPPTWGFHVGYNPWTGWNFGVSWSNGFFSFGMAWSGGWDNDVYRPWGCCGGWYGGGYRGPVVIDDRDINIGNSVNVGNRATARNRIDRDLNASLDRSRRNIYNRNENRSRNADRAAALSDVQQARPAANRTNDVFADSNGNVARRGNDGWQSRQDGEWRTDAVTRGGGGLSTGTDRISQPAMQRTDFDRSGLDRAYAAREHGMSRRMSRPGGMRGSMRRR